MAIPALQLNTGTSIPQVGFGLWQVTDEAEATQSVKDALEAGYTHFDTAQVYGNEQYLGAALKEVGADRSGLFITTKIWNDNQAEADLLPSFDASLERLQMDYVDLLLSHFPVTESRQQAWPLMEQIVESGRARAIGVSNYTVTHLRELLASCKVVPAVNQVELHVFLQQPELLAYCAEQGIVVEAYSPLAHGEGLGNLGLIELAEKYHKTPGQIMIRWCIEKNTVPLPKSVHRERIEQNIDVFDFTLDPIDLEKLSDLEKNHRTAWDPTDTP